MALAFAGALFAGLGSATAGDWRPHHGLHFGGVSIFIPGQLKVQLGHGGHHYGHGYHWKKRHYGKPYRGHHYGGYGYRGHGYGGKGYGRHAHHGHVVPHLRHRGHGHHPKHYGGHKGHRYQVQQCYEVRSRGYGGHRIVCPGGYAYKPFKQVPKYRHNGRHGPYVHY
ncbi:MAG: hypothetical protein AAGA45_06340 [Verrucomicrobiota bacterium]